MMDRRTFMAGMSAATAAAALPQSAQAQGTAWPNAKAITLIVPFFGGSTTDMIARTVMGKVSEQIRQSIIIDDRPGAGGILGSSAVAKAPADGYTLLSGTISTHAINASLYKKLPYDPVKDFEPVSLLGELPNLLVVNSDLGLNSVADLVALLKKDEKKRNYGSAGAGTSTHLAAELFARIIGVPLTHVPYKGNPPAISGVASGELTFMFNQMTTAAPMIKTGRVKPLAVTTLHRTPFMPQLPTMIEAGIPDFESVSWHAIYAPKGTPKQIVDRLSAEIAIAVKHLEVKERLASTMGMEMAGSTPAELSKLMQREITRWAEVVRQSGVAPD